MTIREPWGVLVVESQKRISIFMREDGTDREMAVMAVSPRFSFERARAFARELAGILNAAGVLPPPEQEATSHGN
jgi:hypothetical protein